MKKICILGVNGFIGHHLSKRILADTGWEVYGMDMGSDRLGELMANPRFHFFEGDITINREWIEYHIRKCDVILPLVAIATPATYVREPLRVFLEKVRHLVFRREGITRRREAHTRQAVETRRREKPERIPPIAPCVADAWVRVEDDERSSLPREEVSDRQAGLSGADDHGLDALWISHASLPRSVLLKTEGRTRASQPTDRRR